METKDKAPKTVTVKLSQPYKWGEEEISEIVLNMPKAKHLTKISGSPTFGELLEIASKVSGHSSKFIEELDAPDALAIASGMGEFFR